MGIVKFEDTLEAALKKDQRGANILDIPEALYNVHIDGLKVISRGGKTDKNITFKYSVSVEDFKKVFYSKFVTIKNNNMSEVERIISNINGELPEEEYGFLIVQDIPNPKHELEIFKQTMCFNL